MMRRVARRWSRGPRGSDRECRDSDKDRKKTSHRTLRRKRERRAAPNKRTHLRRRTGTLSTESIDQISMSMEPHHDGSDSTDFATGGKTVFDGEYVGEFDGKFCRALVRWIFYRSAYIVRRACISGCCSSMNCWRARKSSNLRGRHERCSDRPARAINASAVRGSPGVSSPSTRSTRPAAHHRARRTRIKSRASLRGMCSRLKASRSWLSVARAIKPQLGIVDGSSLASQPLKIQYAARPTVVPGCCSRGLTGLGGHSGALRR